jgi:hypothetical protein
VNDVHGDGRADVVWPKNSGEVGLWISDGLAITSVGFPRSMTPDENIEN